jgi:hypothetical protein
MRNYITLIIILISFSLSYSQTKKLFIESAIRFTGDAEMAFVGPSFSIGPGVHLGDRWSVSSTYTYFRSSYTDDGAKATFQTHSIDLIPNFHFREVFNTSRGIYIGAGIAWQQRRQTPESNMTEKPDYWTGAFNLGYRFPIKINDYERSLSIDLKAYGPYKEVDGINTYTEVLTQFMFGIRFRY